MWWSIRDQRPGWVTSAANHGVETVDPVLRALAPTDVLLEWHAALPANEQLKDDFARDKAGNVERDANGNPKPTRTLRVRYIAAQRGVPAEVVKYTTKGLTGVMRELQRVKHAGSDAHGACVETVAVSIEACLIGLIGRQ